MSSADAALAASAARAPAGARAPGWRLWKTGAVAAALWAGVGGLTLGLPNIEVGFTSWSYTREFGVAALALAALLLLAAVSGREQARPAGAAPRRTVVRGAGGGRGRLGAGNRQAGPAAQSFFAPPQSLIEVYVSDYKRLLDSLINSLWLLFNGFALGAAAGFLTGVAIGWSRGLGYWVHPVLRFLGPVPSTALLPMAFYFFPSGWSAAVFLIALATWFPVTVLTWSGVAGVNRAYYDVARTMGASEWFLVLRVAIPAALPQVFVGLFMGLGASFSVLVAAEMMGVKSGLGWYLSWAQGWASYANMYGALIVMALVFSGLITLLFLGRDRLLAWQKESSNGSRGAIGFPGAVGASTGIRRCGGRGGGARPCRCAASITASSWKARPCRCWTTSTWISSRASSWLCSVRAAAASPRCCAWSRDWNRQPRARCWPTASPSPVRRPRASWCSRTPRCIPGARSGTTWRWACRRAACSRPRARAWTMPCSASACRPSARLIRISCPAAWRSARRWRARWSMTRAS